MIVITTETTAAKIGRTMKNWLMRMPSLYLCPLSPPAGRGSLPLLSRRGVGRSFRDGERLALGAHLLAGPGAMQSLGDHPFIARDAFARHAQSVGQWAWHDGLARHRAVLADGQHVLVGLVGADRLVGNEDGDVGGGTRDAHTREQTGG